LPNSNWASPASISFTTLTGIFWYHPYIHLAGMRKPTKSLNIICKQAVLLKNFSPVLYLPARLCEHKILVYRVLMYPIIYFNSAEIKSAQRNFAKCLFVS
jgi:hypothetical protein